VFCHVGVGHVSAPWQALPPGLLSDLRRAKKVNRAIYRENGGNYRGKEEQGLVVFFSSSPWEGGEGVFYRDRSSSFYSCTFKSFDASG